MGGKKYGIKGVEGNDETLNGLIFSVLQFTLDKPEPYQKICSWRGGYIIMDDGANISISRSKRQEFMDQFAKFLNSKFMISQIFGWLVQPFCFTGNASSVLHFFTTKRIPE